MTKAAPETEFLPDVRTDFPFFAETSQKLIGWPGYRTLPGKSGLAYLETVAEEAHFEGSMLRWLFTGKVITHNPVYLLAFFIFGMLTGGIPLLLIVFELLSGGSLASLPLFGMPVIAVGVALLANIWSSLTRPDEASLIGD